MIGILGGMGPQAGVDLASRIVAETDAHTDQEHVSMLLYSPPGEIPDRVAFLLGHSPDSPAMAIAEGFGVLESAGATVTGMACNTAHAPPIFNEVVQYLDRMHVGMKVLHLIDETVRGLVDEYPDARRIGVLGTRGTLQFRLYDQLLETLGFTPVLPHESIRNGVLHDAIYHPERGLKACSSPASPEASAWLRTAMESLVDAGADAIILGCTELPLAFQGRSLGSVPVLDPGRFLARALIRAIRPDRLKPFGVETRGTADDPTS